MEGTKTRKLSSVFVPPLLTRESGPKLTLRNGLIHQTRLTWLSFKASLAILPLAAAAIHSLTFLFQLKEEKGNATNSSESNSVFGTFPTNERGNLIWFLSNGMYGMMRVHYVWWGLTQYARWGKSKELFNNGLACIAFFLVFNGVVGIVSAVTEDVAIGVWNVLVPALFVSSIASEVLNNLARGKHTISSSLVPAFIVTTILFGFAFLVLLFITANLRMENETTRAIISGIVYPGADVALKYMYRKTSMHRHETKTHPDAADLEIKDQAFIYISRNLEIGLAKPNLVLIFLLKSQTIFTAALMTASLAELGGLFVSNLRFTKAAQRVKARMSIRKVLPSNDGSSDPNTKSSIDDHGQALQMEKDKQMLAILRNGEEMCVILFPPLFFTFS